MPGPFLPLWFCHSKTSGKDLISSRTAVCNFLKSSATSAHLGSNFFHAPYTRTPSAYVLLLLRQTKFHTHTKQGALCVFQFLYSQISSGKTNNLEVKVEGIPRVWLDIDLFQKYVHEHKIMVTLPESSSASPFTDRALIYILHDYCKTL
jgi:hypothetical protein